MVNVLYVFGGEKASGAEKVIERLISHNFGAVNPHLFISPGEYAFDLQTRVNGLYPIYLVKPLKKLNRGNSSKLKFYFQAIINNLKVSWLVVKYINKQDIKVVHANTIVPAFYLFPAIVFFKLFNKKIKFIWSDHDLQYFSSFDNKLASIASSLYDCTITVSKAVSDKYARSEKVITLYNGINMDEFKPDPNSATRFRERWGYTNDELLIGIAATIEPRKGQLELVNVFESLAKKRTGIRLLLAGSVSTDYDKYTKAVLNAAESGKDIKYLGKINDMPEFYNACDIIVNNSNAEGSEPLGTTIYEAMAIEKIVVASNTGGSPEIITDEQDGFLFKCQDEKALIGKLDRVIAEFDSLNTVRQNARLKVVRKFDIDIMVNGYNKIIGALIN